MIQIEKVPLRKTSKRLSRRGTGLRSAGLLKSKTKLFDSTQHGDGDTRKSFLVNPPAFKKIHTMKVISELSNS